MILQRSELRTEMKCLNKTILKLKIVSSSIEYKIHRNKKSNMIKWLQLKKNHLNPR